MKGAVIGAGIGCLAFALINLILFFTEGHIWSLVGFVVCIVCVGINARTYGNVN